MNPVDRLRIEKAAADCGFEMSPVTREDGLELRSARFPESVVVYRPDKTFFRVTTTNSALLDSVDEAGGVVAQDWNALYSVLRTAAAHARTLAL